MAFSKTLCLGFLIVLVAVVAAQVTPEEQEIIDKYNELQAKKQRERRQTTSGPGITSENGDMMFAVEDGKRVGMKLGGKTIYFDDLEQKQQDYTDATVSAISLGYSMALPALAKIPALEVKMDLNNRIDDIQKGLNDDLKKALDDVADQTNTAVENVTNLVDDALSSVDKKVSDTLGSVEKEVGKIDAIGDKVDALFTSKGLADKCANGEKDNDETDVDCGGSCVKCATTKVCKVDSDCLSNSCASGKCTACNSDNDCSNGLFCYKTSGFPNTCATCEILKQRGIDEEKITFQNGRKAYCSGGFLVPAQGTTHFTFESCGKTGSTGPSDAECVAWYARTTNMAGTVRVQGSHPGRGDGGFQTWTAPMSGDYEFTAFGAEGGHDQQASDEGMGGQGGIVKAIVKDVQRGTKFYFRIGQKGYDCVIGSATGSTSTGQDRCASGTWIPGSGYNNQYNACGGFNGGGPAICYSNPGGSSGGGATDIRMCTKGGACQSDSPAFTQRIIVAGGGGGSAVENNHMSSGGSRMYMYPGGNGGGLVGEHGYSAGRYSQYQGHRATNNPYGLGGTQTAGGRNNRNQFQEYSTPGALGQGGTSGRNDAGGGGGGYYGGGGAGWNGGGGGGSSYAGGITASGKPEVIYHRQGGNLGDGKILVRIR